MVIKIVHLLVRKKRQSTVHFILEIMKRKKTTTTESNVKIMVAQFLLCQTFIAACFYSSPSSLSLFFQILKSNGTGKNRKNERVNYIS